MAQRNLPSDSDVDELDVDDVNSVDGEDSDDDDDDDDDDSSGPALNADGTVTKKLKRGVSADSAKDGKAREFEMNVNLPGSVDGFLRKYGEKITLKLLHRIALQTAGSATRIPLTEGATDAELQELVYERIENLGKRKPRGPVDPKAVIRKKLEGKTEEEVKAFFAEMYAEFGLSQ